jgi:hypothetical protein
MQSNIPTPVSQDHHLKGVDELHTDQPQLIYVSQLRTWYKLAGLEMYLQGAPIALLPSLTKTPVDSEAGTKPAQAIWNAAAGVVQVGEHIIAHSDEFIQKYAAQIHPHEIPQRPLQALKGAATLRVWAEPWQRILMFFVRTQVCRLVPGKGGTIRPYPRGSKWPKESVG